MLALCALCSLAFGVGSAVLASYAATGFSGICATICTIGCRPLTFPISTNFSTSSIVTRLTTDVANIQMGFQMCIRIAIRCPMMLILATINAYRISPRLCFVYCMVLPLLACGLLVLIRMVHKIFTRVFKTYDKLNNVVQENVHGIRVVKSFVREDLESRKFTDVSGSIYKSFCPGGAHYGLQQPLMQFAVYTCLIVISFLGANLVVASGNNAAMGLTTGGLNAMFTYTTQILSSLMMLSMVFVMLTMARPCSAATKFSPRSLPSITRSIRWRRSMTAPWTSTMFPSAIPRTHPGTLWSG